MTPRTEAGRRLLNWSAYDGVTRAEEILAIEAEAAGAALAALRDLNERSFPDHLSSCHAMGGPGRDVYRESMGYPCDCGLTKLRKNIAALLDGAAPAAGEK